MARYRISYDLEEHHWSIEEYVEGDQEQAGVAEERDNSYGRAHREYVIDGVQENNKSTREAAAATVDRYQRQQREWAQRGGPPKHMASSIR